MPRATIVHVKPANSGEQKHDEESLSTPTVATAIPVSPNKSLSPRVVLARILPTDRSDVETGDMTANFTPRELILFEGYKVSRIIRYVSANFCVTRYLCVRVCSIIEIGFIVLFGLLVPSLFVTLPFPICGYVGAKKFNYCLLYTYTVFTILQIIFAIISIILFFQSPVYLVLRVLEIVFNIFILRNAKMLTGFVKELQPEDRYFLSNNPAIRSIEQGLLI